MPEPSWVRARRPSTRWKRSKTRGSSCRRDADAGVARRAARRGRPSTPQRDANLALERELEGVREQVEDDLLPHLADRRRPAPAAARSRRERQPRALDRRAERARQVGRQRGEIDRLELRLRPGRLRCARSRAACSPASAAAARSDVPTVELLAARAAVRRSRSASSIGPSISVSGVRNSWLTLLKNAVFARSSSASASARRRSLFVRARARESGADLADEETDEVPVRVVEHGDRG